MNAQGHDPYAILDEEEAPKRHQNLPDLIRWLMSQPRGRELARILLGKLYAHRVASTPQAAGAQVVGMWLWDAIRSHAADAIPLMWEEESVRDRN